MLFHFFLRQSSPGPQMNFAMPSTGRAAQLAVAAIGEMDLFAFA